MVNYPIKISKKTRVLLRPPEKEGEWLFSLPTINILNRHLRLSCIISEDSPVPSDVLSCEKVIKYKKKIRFFSKEYFRIRRIISEQKFDIFVDMNEPPMPIIVRIAHPDISISYRNIRRFNIQIKYSEDIDYLKKFLLIPNFMGISDKKIVWGIKNRLKRSKKDKKSIGYYFARERLKKKMRKTNVLEIDSVNALSSLSLFITDMNNLLPYAFINNIPIFYIKTPDALNLSGREDLTTITEKNFSIKTLDSIFANYNTDGER